MGQSLNSIIEHISFKQMLEQEVADILCGYINGYSDYYWMDGKGDLHKITELDLLRGRFITNNGDFSEFEWELKEENIYQIRHGSKMEGNA